MQLGVGHALERRQQPAVVLQGRGQEGQVRGHQAGAPSHTPSLRAVRGSWVKSMRDAVRNKERWKRRRAPTQDPSTNPPACSGVQIKAISYGTAAWCASPMRTCSMRAMPHYAHMRAHRRRAAQLRLSHVTLARSLREREQYYHSHCTVWRSHVGVRIASLRGGTSRGGARGDGPVKDVLRWVRPRGGQGLEPARVRAGAALPHRAPTGPHPGPRHARS